MFALESVFQFAESRRSRAPICADLISGMRSFIMSRRKPLIGLKGSGEIGSHISTSQPQSFANLIRLRLVKR